MRLTFTGWRKWVKTHDHDVIPVEGAPERLSVVKGERAIRWNGPLTALGRVSKLGLSGDFLVEISFDEQGLRNWLEQYVRAEPERALRLLLAMQAEAVIALNQREQAARKASFSASA
jgi:hypothetical protein